jgi:hypothetical protein
MSEIEEWVRGPRDDLEDFGIIEGCFEKQRGVRRKDR